MQTSLKRCFAQTSLAAQKIKVAKILRGLQPPPTPSRPSFLLIKPMKSMICGVVVAASVPKLPNKEFYQQHNAFHWKAVKRFDERYIKKNSLF